MQDYYQKHAVWMWLSLPHLLIWLGFLLLVIWFGFDASYLGIQPALPLMVAFIWLWEWRSTGIGLSLFISGLCVDILSGMPIGWHALLWTGFYIVVPSTIHQFSEDEPFIVRWLICAVWLALYLLAELLLAALYDLAIPTLQMLVLRWLVMICCLPAVSWLTHRCKQLFYRKLWMLLPEEMRISVR